MGCLLTRVQHGRLLGLRVGEGAAHRLPLWLHIVPIYARLVHHVSRDFQAPVTT